MRAVIDAVALQAKARLLACAAHHQIQVLARDTPVPPCPWTAAGPGLALPVSPPSEDALGGRAGLDRWFCVAWRLAASGDPRRTGVVRWMCEAYPK